MSTESIDIGEMSDVVPVARRFAAGALARFGCAGVSDAAELVVSELVTNAVLHGGFPVRLTVSGENNAVRVEVHDGSRDVPVRGLPRPQGMTGRGLALVDAVANRWGAEPTPDGKFVWAEITEQSAAAEEPGDVSVETVLASFEDAADFHGPQRFTVTLGDVPTDLLLEAKAHVDSVIRELTLSASGAASGMTAALPPHLASLVHTVVTEFSAARQSIKRQALAAAERGDPRTSLTLTLPVSAADAGDRYLAALEDADAFARASRLLTVAAPPQHRAFRRWYVTSLAQALRQKAAGLPRSSAPTFEAYLLDQVDELAELQEVSHRAARLQRITAALAAELSAERAAEVALDDAIAELGADRGSALLLSGGAIVSAADRGYLPDRYAPLRAAWQDGAGLPALTAAVDGRPVWLESVEECDTRYPQLRELEEGVAALCAVPMTVADHVVGVLRLVFSESRLFTFDERAFLAALGAVTAQAIERSRLFELQATVASKLTRLQRVTSALSQAQSLDEVLDVTVEHATGLVGARVASISLLGSDGDTVRLVRVLPTLPAASTWATFRLDDNLPASEAIRTGGFLSTESVAERDARWPTLAKLDWGFEHALVVIPLHADNSTIGALTLSFDEGSDGQERARDFLTAFADACAQAIERARAAERADEAYRKLAFLASASEELAISLDITRTLSNVARLAVPEMADWCVVHLLQSGDLNAVAIEHVDPKKRELAVEAQRRWPERLGDPTAVARVVRSGVPLRVADIPSYAAGAPPQEGRDPEQVALLEKLGLVSVIIAPLRGRRRTLGAMTFITAESGRRYSESDQAFVEDLAGRAAIAIENASLFQESLRDALFRPGSPGGANTVADSDPMLTAAAIGRFEIDLTNRTMVADDVVAKLLCFEPTDDPGSLDTYLRRIHPDDAPRVQSALDHAVRYAEDYSVEHRVVPPDGSSRWIVARGRVLTDDPRAIALLAGVMYESTTDRERRDDLARLLETMTDAFYRLDRDWNFTYVNTQAERILFAPRSELLGRTLWDCFPELVGSEIDSQFRQALVTGNQAAFEYYYQPLLSSFELRATPDPEGLSVFFHDVTARKDAEAARVRAHDRLALLGEAARGLVGTHDVATVMHQVASVVVPRLADWVVITMVDSAGRPHAHHGLHYDAVLAAEAARVARLIGELLSHSVELAEVLTAGNPLVLGANDIRTAAAAIPGSELPTLLETLGFASIVLVPLQSGAAVVGFLALVNGPARTPFDDQDIATGVDIGRRAGLALENAQLTARQRNASEVLQRSLLTPLPEPRELQVVARYRPAGQEAQIGGDWYDSFLQPDGATVLAIGDVVGHDMNAAAAMGQLRSLLRGVAFDRADPPAAVLQRVDAAIRGLRVDTLATAIVGRLDQTDEQRLRAEHTFHWSNAGHPPPMLMRRDGTVVVLDEGDDLLLGFDPETDRHDHTVTIAAGDTLLLYTDGLVERRDSPIEEGLRRLEQAFGDLVDADLDSLCDELVQILLPANADDDVALVAVRALRND